jgi:class 3 adenylate cyclase
MSKSTRWPTRQSAAAGRPRRQGHRRSLESATRPDESSIEDYVDMPAFTLSVPSAVLCAVKPTAPVALQTSTDAAERRQLTVMFCDLVGSTAMSARLDPEDMRGIVGVYHRCWANRIGHCGGFVDAWATACSPISAIRKPHLLFAPPLTPPRAATRSCRRALRRRCGRGPRARSPEAAVRRRRDGSRHRAGARTRRPCRP